MNTDDRLASEWRGLKIEKFSTISEWRHLNREARAFVESCGHTEIGPKLRDVGVTVWRAKVGLGARWEYANTMDAAVSAALDAACTVDH